MLTYKVVAQPEAAVEYRSLLVECLTSGAVEHIDVAVAYATYGGAAALVKSFEAALGGNWPGLQKRWLVGIDWLRSQPTAIELLQGLPASEVKIHDGKYVVSKAGCTPRLPYHPKTFLFRGTNCRAAVIGSGNLSRNGLLAGHEVGAALLIDSGTGVHEQQARAELDRLASWFESLWAGGSKWAGLRQQYLDAYKTKTNLSLPTPTDDDSAETDDITLGTANRGFSAAQLRQLRAADTFWIEAGVLSKNRGPGNPGNQLMMRRFSRVFFGFEARDVPRDSHIGQISIKYGSFIRDDCTIRYSNNSMDVLSLPVPGNGGPPSYDGQILAFSRTAKGTYTLTVHSSTELSAFRKRSDRVGGSFAMSSARRFGVY
jgi:hypothetical protein